MTLYTLLKFIHVLSAIVAFGANLTYAVWLGRAQKRPAALVFTLHTVKMIDDWVANPAYILLLPSGWWLASLAGWSLTTPWILSALIMYAVLAIAGLGLYSPALRKQIAIAESMGVDAPEYRSVSLRSNAIGIGLNFLVLLILYLMIAKPALWS